MVTLRVIDSGQRSARENLAITEALCRLHQQGESGETLRFQHFPRSAIIGRHQRLAREVDLGWCEKHNVETARRMTGGGAIIMGPGMLGWELILSRHRLPPGLGTVTSAICETVAAGLSTLGINAAFRPRNDIEVDGRKLCGTGGYYDGNTLVFQGTVLIATDHELLANALHLPAHKLEKRAIATLAERITDLGTLLDPCPPMDTIKSAMAIPLAALMGATPVQTTLTGEELALAQSLLHDNIGTDSFVRGDTVHLPSQGRAIRVSHTGAGAHFEAIIHLHDGREAIIDQAAIHSDAFISPARSLLDLEAALRHHALADAAAIATAFWQKMQPMMLGATPDDVIKLLQNAAETPS